MPRWLPALALLDRPGCRGVRRPALVEQQGKAPAANVDAEQAAGRAQVEGGLKARCGRPSRCWPTRSSFASTRRAGASSPRRSACTHGVPDTRGHMNWLDDDLASRTVADRLAMYKKHKFHGHSRRTTSSVRLVWDTHRRAARRTSRSVFAERLQPARGRHRRRACWPARANVYFTCIPDLYLLKDTKGDGQGGREEVAGHRVRHPRAVHRPRPARPADGAGRQALLLASATAG